MPRACARQVRCLVQHSYCRSAPAVGVGERVAIESIMVVLVMAMVLLRMTLLLKCIFLDPGEEGKQRFRGMWSGCAR